MTQPPTKTVLFTLGITIGTVLLLSFGQLLRIELPRSLAIYPHDVLLPIILLLFMWIHRRDNLTGWIKWASCHRLETMTLLFFTLSSLAQLTITGNPVQILYLLRVVIYTGALWAIAIVIKQQRNTQWLFFGSAALLLWFSFIMYVLFPDSRGLSFFGWDEHYFRMIGTLFDPNFTGMVLVAGTVFSLFVIRTWTASSVVRNSGLVALVAFSLGIGLTFSRSALVSLALSICILLILSFFQQRQNLSGILKLTTLSVCCVILALLVTPKPGGEGIKLLRTASVMTRVTSDSDEVISSSNTRLLLGSFSLVSKSNRPKSVDSPTSMAYHPKTANNIFITLLTWGGAFGLLLCLGLLTKWGTFLITHHAWAAVMAAAWLSNAQFNNSLFEPFCFLLVGGMLLSVILID